MTENGARLSGFQGTPGTSQHVALWKALLSKADEKQIVPSHHAKPYMAGLQASPLPFMPPAANSRVTWRLAPCGPVPSRFGTPVPSQSPSQLVRLQGSRAGGWQAGCGFGARVVTEGAWQRELARPRRARHSVQNTHVRGPRSRARAAVAPCRSPVSPVLSSQGASAVHRAVARALEQGSKAGG